MLAQQIVYRQTLLCNLLISAWAILLQILQLGSLKSNLQFCYAKIYLFIYCPIFVDEVGMLKLFAYAQ